MPLKIKRETLERIVIEELARFSQRALNEAGPQLGTVDDEIPDPDAAPEEQMPNTSPAPEAGDMEEPPELPTGDEPADDDIEDDLNDDESGAEPGTVAYELQDKTVESVSMEEESKILPGATEIVINFREFDDALRLLVAKNGTVKIFFRGLHNDFGSPVEEIPGEDAEGDDDLGLEEPPEGEIDMGGEDIEEMPPMGPDDMPPPEEDEEGLPPKV